MADFPALPLFTDAYLADCSHLSDAEHGRYLRLLMLVWLSPECRVPNDDKFGCFISEEFFALAEGMVVPGQIGLRHVDWTLHPCRILDSTWRRIRNAFLSTHEKRCTYCGTTNSDVWHVDHIKARSMGGTHAWKNLAVSCPPCNWSKGAS